MVFVKKHNTLCFFAGGKKGVPGESPWTPDDPSLSAADRGFPFHGKAVGAPQPQGLWRVPNRSVVFVITGLRLNSVIGVAERQLGVMDILAITLRSRRLDGTFRSALDRFRN